MSSIEHTAVASPDSRAAAGLDTPTERHEVLSLTGVGFQYGQRMALEGIGFSVLEGELLALLGPNGSGKSTLLRILATLYRPAAGEALMNGLSLSENPAAARRLMGVVFQSPGLDGKLTVAENLHFQGLLYGMSGRVLKRRIGTLLERFGLESRRKDHVETLSGGLQRRVELAKALLHDPPVLLLDEPSTGLDLAARQSLWQTLDELRSEGRLTVVLTTHLMEEAERCDRVALLDEGRLVALDDPPSLRRRVGETIITLEGEDLPALARGIAERFKVEPQHRDGQLLLNGTDAAMAIRLLETFPQDITALRLGRPTLGDVFLALTGREFTTGGDEGTAPGGAA